MMVTINDLPNELLTEIFSLLATTPAPSASRLHAALPTLDIVSSKIRDLKSISSTSRLWRQVVLPMLFRHATLEISRNQLHCHTSSKEIAHFASFLLTTPIDSPISNYVKSFVLRVTGPAPGSPEVPYNYDTSNGLWEILFKLMNPSRVTIVAAPSSLRWSITCRPFYHLIPSSEELQALSLERDPEANVPLRKLPSSLLQRGWTRLTLNEGSLERWDDDHYQASGTLVPMLFRESTFSRTINDFSYVSCWPPPLHFSHLIWNLPRLKRFYCQIVPRGISTSVEDNKTPEMLALWDRRNRSYSYLMNDLLSPKAVGNFKYLQEFESGDATEMAAFEAVSQAAKSLKIGWRVEGDGILVRDQTTEDAEHSSDEEDIDMIEHTAIENSIFLNSLRRFAWNGTDNLPVSPLGLYQ